MAAILYGVFTSRSRSQTNEKLSRGYEQVKVGDSRDAVVAAMGKPHEITDCPYTPFTDARQEKEFRSKCFQQYRYRLIPTEYTISFDRNGAVIGKSTTVSP